MKKTMFIVSILIFMFALVGCKNSKGQTFGEFLDKCYPYIEYRNSAYNFDPYNREIPIEDGHILDEGNSYEIIETESGYDIVLHFVKGGEG
jgi:hypothetical protein